MDVFGLGGNCRADGLFLGTYRKSHIPQVVGFYEKFSFKPDNSGWPAFVEARPRPDADAAVPVPIDAIEPPS